MSEVWFEVGEHGSRSRLIVDGVDISNFIRAVNIRVAVGEKSTMTVEHACIRGHVQGSMEVNHICGLERVIELAEEGDDPVT